MRPCPLYGILREIPKSGAGASQAIQAKETIQRIERKVKEMKKNIVDGIMAVLGAALTAAAVAAVVWMMLELPGAAHVDAELADAAARGVIV